MDVAAREGASARLGRLRGISLVLVATLAPAALADPADGSGVAAYRQARQLEAGGDLRAAARDYRALLDEALPAYVRGDVALRAGRLLARTHGEGADAALRRAESLAREAGDGRRAALARALRAEHTLRRSVDAPEVAVLDDAIAQLRAVAREAAGPVDTFAVRRLLAEALGRRGLPEEAVATLQALELDRPAHPDIAEVRAALAALGAAPARDAASRLRQARALVAARRFEEAADVLEGPVPPEAPRASWLHTRGRALFRAR
ncbi:MAG: hypothetical protein AAF447_18150, partial [Myxococcota bacterium]